MSSIVSSKHLRLAEAGLLFVVLVLGALLTVFGGSVVAFGGLIAEIADSAGYLNDTLRPYAYLYRDWVINAVNRDQPFDQFTIEQLAGDLLPNATLEQKITNYV